MSGYRLQVTGYRGYFTDQCGNEQRSTNNGNWTRGGFTVTRSRQQFTYSGNPLQHHHYHAAYCTRNSGGRKAVDAGNGSLQQRSIVHANTEIKGGEFHGV